MVEKVKFTQITRTICPKTGVHYLDAVDTEGFHWMAEVRTDVEKWTTFSRMWHRDPQQPLKND
jgi:hypothetical protein